MKKKVIVLGAGMVSKPMVDYLAALGYQITIADIVFQKAKNLAGSYSNISARQLDSRNPQLTEKLIKEGDLVVSLLPASMHLEIARTCLKFQKHLVTASYASSEMQKLDGEAKNRGVVLLNEMGLDPGLDHMSAMKIFDRIRGEGGKVTQFLSYCGGLMAPEADTNPLGYKFSWSPKGVLSAAASDARYLKDGREITVPGKDLFKHYWLVEVDQAGIFEAYPNRDSLGYIQRYNLQDVKTICRGTLRKIGHCDTWRALSRIGFFNDSVQYSNLRGSIADFIREKLLGMNQSKDLRAALQEILELKESDIILKKFAWLGFFSDPIPVKAGSPMDVLTMIMLNRMSFAPGERDMIVLQHEFTVEYPDTHKRITSSLVEYGIPRGDSAMARTVALPAAIGVKMILEGDWQRAGVHIPLQPEVYTPVLDELEKLGISIKEECKEIEV